MSIGGGIALIIVGAILSFAINADIPGINLDAVGVICMAGGAVGLIIGLALLNRRTTARRLSTTEVTERQQTASGDAVIRRTDRDIT